MAAPHLDASSAPALRAPVPSLLALAGGFTLIELMLAVAVGSVVLLLAVTTVRTAAGAVRDLSRASTENALVRQGWLLAMNDVDYWHSHANPEFPYLKGGTSDRVLVGGSADNPFDKRTFRRVAWRKDTVPGQLLPDDPRSWYRGAAMPGTTPRLRLAPNWDLVFVIKNETDPTTSFETGWRPRLVLPEGWSPWHITGDHALLANVDDADGGIDRYGNRTQPQPPPATPGAQRVQMAVFEELGHLGVYTYMPPGTPNLVLRPSTNKRTANIGKPDSWYDWGELPWSLSYGTSTDPKGYNASDQRVPSAAQRPNRQRQNYLIGNPGSDDDLWVDSVERTEVPKWYFNDASNANKCWLVDLDRTTRGARHMPVAALIGNRAFPTQDPDKLDTDTLVDGVVLDPWRVLVDDVFGVGGNANDSYRMETTPNHIDRMRKRFTSTTSHLPALPTDAPVPEEQRRIPGQATLATAIFRARLASGDRAWSTVLVQNPDAGTRIELTFSALGTTLRGARQHWGWKSAIDRPDLKAMGDVYAP